MTEGTEVPAVGRAAITIVDARADATFAGAWSTMVGSHGRDGRDVRDGLGAVDEGVTQVRPTASSRRAE